jgi:hypothetical protein
LIAGTSCDSGVRFALKTWLCCNCGSACSDSMAGFPILGVDLLLANLPCARKRNSWACAKGFYGMIRIYREKQHKTKLWNDFVTESGEEYAAAGRIRDRSREERWEQMTTVACNTVCCYSCGSLTMEANLERPRSIGAKSSMGFLRCGKKKDIGTILEMEAKG